MIGPTDHRTCHSSTGGTVTGTVCLNDESYERSYSTDRRIKFRKFYSVPLFCHTYEIWCPILTILSEF